MTLKMKAEIKQQWVDALRLGNHQQGKGYLHSMQPVGFDEFDERFCCLGILSLLCKQAGFVESEPADGGYRIAYGATCETSYLPFEVIDWAGLEFEGERQYNHNSRVEESRGTISRGTRREFYRDELSLSVMNDRGKSFEEIAGEIETHVIGV